MSDKVVNVPLFYSVRKAVREVVQNANKKECNMKLNAVLGPKKVESCLGMVKRGALPCIFLVMLATGVAARAESSYPNIAYGDAVTISENHADTMVSVAAL